MGWALGVPVGGNQKIILLGLANHAHPDGSEAYPTLDRLAAYARCDRSTARRNVRKLIADGWVVEDGAGPKGQAKYRLQIGGLQNATPESPAGVAKRPEGGGTAVLPEPSIEPSSSSESVDSESGRLLDDEDDRRAQALLGWYVGELGRRRGEAPRPSKGWLAAARRIVKGREGSEIRALVVWALDKNAYFFGRASTLPKLAQHYADIRGSWLADQNAQQRSAAIRRERQQIEQGPGPAASRIRYDQERIVVER